MNIKALLLVAAVISFASCRKSSNETSTTGGGGGTGGGGTTSTIALSAQNVPNNLALGAVVAEISLTGVYEGTPAEFVLVDGVGSDDNGKFQISGNQLLNNHVVDNLQNDYTIRIQASISGVNFVKVFGLVLGDGLPGNDAPTDIELSDNSVMEYLMPGTLVGTLSSTDANEGDVHSYTLVDGEDSEDNASFTISGALLKTAEEFDYDIQKEYKIRVRTFDGTDSYEEAFVIDILEDPTTVTAFTSSLFVDGGTMPSQTGNLEDNLSPDFSIVNLPTGTVEMVLIMRDLDAPASNNMHWVVWNIPTTKTEIAQGETWADAAGVVVGDNHFGTGYVGPYPSTIHNYEFTLYFLSEEMSAVAPSQFATVPGLLSADGLVIDSKTITAAFDPTL